VSEREREGEREGETKRDKETKTNEIETSIKRKAASSIEQVEGGSPQRTRKIREAKAAERQFNAKRPRTPLPSEGTTSTITQPGLTQNSTFDPESLSAAGIRQPEKTLQRETLQKRP